MEGFSFDEEELEPIQVIGPSGAIFDVLHEKEKLWWDNSVKAYLNDFKFTNASDLQDLDRILGMELILYRYQQWVSIEKDYWGQAVAVSDLNKAMKDKSVELRGIKKEVGINKVSREKDQADNVAAYIENLRRRAHEFGVMRNEQAVKAITLFQQLIALVTLFDNCTEDERREQHIQLEDLLEWIKEIIPEFTNIDEQFRKTSQKYWIDSL